jgi:hypothetical protein
MRTNENEALRAVLSLRSITVLISIFKLYGCQLQVLIRLHGPIALRAMISPCSIMLQLQALLDLQRYRSCELSFVLICPD